ncbi:MAG: hypothetical protein AAF741_18805 [Bacteroidota bacterium]
MIRPATAITAHYDCVLNETEATSSCNHFIDTIATASDAWEPVVLHSRTYALDRITFERIADLLSEKDCADRRALLDIRLSISRNPGKTPTGRVMHPARIKMSYSPYEGADFTLSFVKETVRPLQRATKEKTLAA